jgi:hypothetical protein
MNRIYQGKVTAVEIPFPSSEGSGVGQPKDDQGNPKWKPFDADPNKNREQWQSARPSTAKHANHAKLPGHKRAQRTQMIGYRPFAVPVILSASTGERNKGEVSRLASQLSTINPQPTK